MICKDMSIGNIIIPIRSMSTSYTKVPMRNTFGDWLRAEIKRSGKTQAEFAQSIGIEQPHLSRILSGTRGASADTLKNVAVALGISEQIVFAKAGILTETNPVDQKVKEAAYLLSMLEDDDLEEIIEIARMKLDRQKPKQQTSRSRRPARSALKEK